jgi:hypothetical protein
MTVKMVLLDYFLAASLTLVSSVSASILPRQQNATLASCPGYKASGVETTGNGLTATLTLAGTACNVYGTDLEELTLTVEYQSGMLLACSPRQYIIETDTSQRPASARQDTRSCQRSLPSPRICISTPRSQRRQQQWFGPRVQVRGRSFQLFCGSTREWRGPFRHFRSTDRL